MKNLKIAKKLWITFIIILVMVIATALMAISSLRNVGKNFDTFYNSPYQVTNTTMDMRRSLEAAIKNVGYAVMSDDPKQISGYVDQAQRELEPIQGGIDFLYANFTGDKALVSEFEATIQASDTAKEKVFAYARGGQNAFAIKTLFNEYSPQIYKAQEQILAINAFSSNKATELYNAANFSKTVALGVLVVISIIASVFTFLMAAYITKSLVNPIIEIETAAEQMAAGSLNVSIEYTSKDELGLLSQSMRTLTSGVKDIVEDIAYVLGELSEGNFTVKTRAAKNYIGDYSPIIQSVDKIINDLSHTLIQINNSSEQVASGSGQVSSGAQALSQGATEQASAIEELSATIQEMSAQIETNAADAKRAEDFTAEAGEGVVESNGHMQAMIVAMEDITDKSSQIGKIIKTIDDIAFQTNILALNAAVEAARAGSAGKGFAVVADEVRNLAQKSAEAAKVTTTLIEGTVAAVGNGTKIAEDTAKSLAKVVDVSSKVTGMIQNIAKASVQQAEGAHHITIGVEQISAVIQTNSATAEQSAAASEELSAQSEMLKELVGKFNLPQQ